MFEQSQRPLDTGPNPVYTNLCTVDETLRVLVEITSNIVESIRLINEGLRIVGVRLTRLERTVDQTRGGNGSKGGTI